MLDTPVAVRRAAQLLHDRTGASVLITWGEQGMWMLDGTTTPPAEEHLDAVTREVADVTGAGDTVIAALAMGLAAGATLVADHRGDDGKGWVVLQDPEGNEFCVERGHEERQEGPRQFRVG